MRRSAGIRRVGRWPSDLFSLETYAKGRREAALSFCVGSVGVGVRTPRAAGDSPSGLFRESRDLGRSAQKTEEQPRALAYASGIKMPRQIEADCASSRNGVISRRQQSTF